MFSGVNVTLNSRTDARELFIVQTRKIFRAVNPTKRKLLDNSKKRFLHIYKHIIDDLPGYPSIGNKTQSFQISINLRPP